MTASIDRQSAGHLPGRRWVGLFGFLACAGMMAYALYVEHAQLIEPCPLCVFQRMAVIGLAVIFLLSAAHNPKAAFGRRVYVFLFALATAGGIAVAGRHVWLQNLPADKVPACGPGFGYIIDSFPLADALKLIFSGSGECASIDWQFLGLSMPTWVLICVVLLGGLGTWNTLRRASV